MNEELQCLSAEVQTIKSTPSCAIKRIVECSNQIKAGMKLKLAKHLLNRNFLSNCQSIR